LNAREEKVVKKSTMHFSFLQGVAAEEHDTTALVGATLMDGYMEQALAVYFGFSTDRCSLLKREGSD
jgi:hypothetical protein